MNVGRASKPRDDAQGLEEFMILELSEGIELTKFDDRTSIVQPVRGDFHNPTH